MERNDVEVVVGPGAVLGEGPVWDERIGRLVWVDIVGNVVHITDTATGDTRQIPVSENIGAVVPRAAGGYLAALRDGFWILKEDDARRVVDVGPYPGLRFNDGKCDPLGRFWAGTIVETENTPAAALYCLNHDMELSLELNDITVSNGLAWSHDGETMYYIDTPTRRIDAISFDLETGAISGRRPYIDLPADVGYPDGMTIDAEGALWIALWDGAAIHRYVDGVLERVIGMPVTRPTSVAFGGSRYDELFVTSASMGLTEQQLADQPLAGALFRVTTDVGGVAPSVFGSS
jgi:sugar lactone lactonase YvrE